jgi:hypothetical protein
MQPQDWLRQFLIVRQLNKPNTQPLYRYRMSDDEFASLHEMLEISVLFSVKHITKMSGWNAAFVIYATEWWRRYYDGGEWSYEAIFASFADNPREQLGVEQRNLIVELGLKYWQRPVRIIHGRSCYLGTIATEGGLPVKQLNNVDELSRLFKHAIPNYLGLHNADIIDAIHIIAEDAPHLLENYQVILGDMLCRVAELNIAHHLANKEDAIDYLNQHEPEWQLQFPLPTHDPVALQLLTEMINTTVKASAVLELSNAEQKTVQTEATPYYYLQGNKLNFPSNVNNVYLGVPELWCVHNETQGGQKIESPLLVRSLNSQAGWQVLTAKHRGVYELQLQDAEGNVQFHDECALLSENFALRFSKNRIDIEHSEHAYIFCESPFVSRINATANGRSIEFNASETPPSYVDVTLRWGRQDGLTLTVPFPVQATQLIDADGNTLSQVFINQLHGVHLRLLAENQAYERHLTVEFSLKEVTLDTYDLYFRDEVSKTGTVIELALINYQQWIEELLAISHDPNSFVRLIVYEQGLERLRTDIMRTVSLPNEPSTTTRHVNTLNEITNLAEALTIHDDRLRQLFIRHRLKQLCINFAADDWHTLRECQTNAPLTANEIWLTATSENRVLAALVLQLDTAFMQRFEPELLVCWELIPLRDWLVIFTRYKNYLVQNIDEADVNDMLSNRIDKIYALSKSLNIITQLLKVQLCAETNDELEFMQTEDALLLITEQLELEQQDLTERKANSEWTEFLCDELFSHWQALPPQTQSLLTPHDVKYHYGVILLPLLLAHFALTPVPSAWQQSNIYLFKLRQLKVFDELWFTSAFTLLVAYLSQQPDYSQPLQQETATMIDSDENDLVTEIEQQLALANEEVQGLQTDVQSLQGSEEALTALFQENQELNATIENLSSIIKKRDDALRLLLTEVTNLNAKIREIRSELQMKNQ